LIGIILGLAQRNRGRKTSRLDGVCPPLAHRQNPKKCCVPASPDQRAPGHKVPEFQFKSVSSASIWGGHVGQAIDLVKEHLDLGSRPY
jgi:hypothetical protein